MGCCSVNWGDANVTVQSFVASAKEGAVWQILWVFLGIFWIGFPTLLIVALAYSFLARIDRPRWEPTQVLDPVEHFGGAG